MGVKIWTCEVCGPVWNRVMFPTIGLGIVALRLFAAALILLVCCCVACCCLCARRLSVSPACSKARDVMIRDPTEAMAAKGCFARCSRLHPGRKARELSVHRGEALARPAALTASTSSTEDAAVSGGI